MKLRRFTDAGIEAFRDHLQQMRSQPTTEFNEGLLEHPELTVIVEPEINVAVEQFLNKGQAATYLDSVLKALDPEGVASDPGMWTWLAGFFIDSVCPIVDEQRVVKNDYYYI